MLIDCQEAKHADFGGFRVDVTTVVGLVRQRAALLPGRDFDREMMQ